MGDSYTNTVFQPVPEAPETGSTQKDPSRLPAGLEAARWAFATKNKRATAQRASLAKPANSPYASPFSIRQAQARFPNSGGRSAVARQMKRLREGKPPIKDEKPKGRPTLLTAEENKGVHAWMVANHKAGIPVTHKSCRAAINSILASRTPPGKTVSKTWMTRWWKDRPAELQEQKDDGDGSQDPKPDQTQCADSCMCKW
ncbi:hypothetical protein BJ166DRAFT_593859 [Pestalotiopsis sp. NC0098]|nr:hypothetical protein BJ166DRAFT_593859 [Pestalotiopsis sp. NC0098]